MSQIAIDDLPQSLQKLLQQAEKTNTPLTITQAGEPFVVIYPAKPKKVRPPFGFMQGTGEIKGDIISPVEQAWEALQ